MKILRFIFALFFYFSSVFLFFLFSIFNFNVMNMDFFSNMLKFGTHIKNEKLYCEKRISHIWLISPFVDSFFFRSNKILPSK